MPSPIAPTAIDGVLASSRSHLYRLLATVFAQEPTPDLLQSLNESTLRADLEAAGLSLPEYDALGGRDRLAETLSVEFTSLFLVPGPQRVVGCESVIRGENRYWGEATVEVNRCYELWGYEVAEECSLPPDHLSVELEFMGHLTRHEAAAAARAEGETVESIRAVERTFLSEHLGTWVGPFADRVEAAAESTYYAGFARMTRDYVASELHELQSVTPQSGGDTSVPEVSPS